MSSIAAMWSPLLFGFALFLSTGLLFIVQPMVAKTLLPQVGGNAIAWNACIVFFQATLLAGCVYAHLLHRFRGLRWQPWMQLLLLGTATTLCFVGIFGGERLNELAPRLAPLDVHPVVSTFALLAVVIGLPYLALAAVGPFVQRWFAHLDHPKASDPYFLFVASNLGGLMGLVIYASLIEPNAPWYAQWMSWQLAVTALGLLLLLVAICAWASPRSPELEPPPPSTDPNAPALPVLIGRGPATPTRRLFWLIASALPMGLMMGVTDYLTLDAAPTPILWTLPLALYLLAMAQSFGRFTPFAHGGSGFRKVMHAMHGLFLSGAVAIFAFGLPGGDEFAVFVGICFVLVLMTPQTSLALLQPISVLVVVLAQANVLPMRGLSLEMVALQLTCFYLSARLCLGMLAADRPAATALTTYYLEVAVGGLAGALFQVFVAPLLFQREYLEFALLAALASTLRPAWSTNGWTDWIVCRLFLPKRDPADLAPSAARRKVGVAFDLALALLVAVLAAGGFWAFRPKAWDEPRLDLALGVALLCVALLYLRPLRFGLALAAIVALSFVGSDVDRDERTIARQRTPFGLLRVTERKQRVHPVAQKNPNPIREYTERTLVHGNRPDGSYITDPPELRRYPTSYYHELGPAGCVMHSSAWFTPPLRDVGGDLRRIEWLQHHRSRVAGDARIAASIVGLAASPVPREALTAAWSEPSYAIIGLGAGSLYAYAHPFQWVDSYELDPAIVGLSANDPPVFEHYRAAQNRGVRGQILVGDPRRHLAKPGREGFYQMIFVDAFNSEGVAVHLLTEEAIANYFHRLRQDGVLCILTTSQNFDLAKMLEKAAQKLDVPMRAVHIQAPSKNDIPGYESAEWVLMARSPAALSKWLDPAGINRVVKMPGVFRFDFRRGNMLWTDEHANVMAPLKQNLGWPNFVYTLLVVVFLFALLLGGIEIAAAMIAKSARSMAPVVKQIDR